jgi:probable HAF family extracellular repeat protein
MRLQRRRRVLVGSAPGRAAALREETDMRIPVVSAKSVVMAVAGLAMTALAAGEALAKPAPEPIDIGTLGGDFSAAHGINEKDEIVGESFTASDQLHAFVWNGSFRDLGTLGGKTSRGLAINAKGHVVGSSTVKADSLDEIAYVWPGAGPLGNLGALPGDHASRANDINDRGVIVGRSGAATFRAVIWKKGRIEALPADAADLSIANAINNRGQVVGVAVVKTVGTRAVLWEDGTMKVLGTLAGTPGATSTATGINERGQIVGRSTSSSGLEHAFLYENGKFTDLGPLSELGLSSAAAIARNGLVAGDATDDADSRRAVLWRKGKITNLGALDPFGTSFATAVNSKGHVAGAATAGGEDADIHAILWR